MKGFHFVVSKALLLLCLLSAFSCHAADDQEQQTWLEQSIGKLTSHKKTIERVLHQAKYALIKKNQHHPTTTSPPWTRPGARVGRTRDEKPSMDSDDTAVQKSEAIDVPEEPHIGMVFQVFEVKESKKPLAKKEQETAAAASDGEIESPRPDVEEEESDLTMYELLEPIQLDLGVVPEHLFDYAYQPVAVGENEQRRHHSTGGMHDGDGRSNAAPEDSVTVKPEASVAPVLTGMWWQWWFTIMKSSSRTHQGYERVGKSAFAGGSHGEVWRGRRRCDPNRKNKELCDDSTFLILKRLKIEHGLPVLEAGLREVYVGNLLATDEDAKSLFTVYVDHFFREVPRPSFLGRGPSKEHELWIVFEDAGPSMRSYLYTAIPSGDFVLHQQSPLWTSLRFNAANFSQSSDASCVAVPNKATWGLGHTGKSHRPQGLPDATVGRPLMREILRQILTAAAYLHERGIVHRDIKPSNVMCQTMTEDISTLNPSDIKCVLGDFSSVWDNFTDANLYYNGPTVSEQTLEYAPPEALPGPSWIPFHKLRPEVYDSWSVGVLALELLLGTPNVFSVDQR
jgi:hypothetical protein